MNTYSIQYFFKDRTICQVSSRYPCGKCNIDPINAVMRENSLSRITEFLATYMVACIQKKITMELGNMTLNCKTLDETLCVPQNPSMEIDDYIIMSRQIIISSRQIYKKWILYNKGRCTKESLLKLEDMSEVSYKSHVDSKCFSSNFLEFICLGLSHEGETEPEFCIDKYNCSSCDFIIGKV